MPTPTPSSTLAALVPVRSASGRPSSPNGAPRRAIGRRPGMLGISLAVAAFAAAAGCAANESSGDAGAVHVRSTDDACEIGATEARSGTVVFDVENAGSQVTEFYLYAEDGLRIVGEVENIGPGITRNLVVDIAPGTYLTACKPGMVGDGIRAPFTVTDSGDAAPAAEIDDLVAAAGDGYRRYVVDEVGQLVEQTRRFAARYTAGDDDAARTLYPAARVHWERIEPVAESFGDLDPLLDLREADLEPGQTWTGWHAIEKDLWPPSDGYVARTDDERRTLAAQLVDDTEELERRVGDLTFDATELGNGAKELLDEIATGKVTGEEEIWSHTDLWDFQANVDGARTAFEALEPALRTKDEALADLLTDRFDALQAVLDRHRDGDGFVLYTDLSDEEVRALADAVNALGEPLAELTAAVVL